MSLSIFSYSRLKISCRSPYWLRMNSFVNIFYLTVEQLTFLFQGLEFRERLDAFYSLLKFCISLIKEDCHTIRKWLFLLNDEFFSFIVYAKRTETYFLSETKEVT